MHGVLSKLGSCLSSAVLGQSLQFSEPVFWRCKMSSLCDTLSHAFSFQL